MVTPNGGVLAGANFNQDSRDGTLARRYGRPTTRMSSSTRMMLSSITKDVPARTNLYNMARIFQAYAFMILTDEYGDIPYTEGGAGYSDQVFFPKYDAAAGNLSKDHTGIDRSIGGTECSRNNRNV